ncbi:hypothetical protein NEMIN01_0547 [Nematocida minor]|uniref:uncharacterized protein n=1 Tax=Nematocida minor TaxID=1912983 RepID=UPI00221FCB7D|nr:uncharacterized protein NEMIN01_0547 [Nematocida minor]KAI5189484.1 hypothetical protein NEMIN01_0547 [Nematocida minor]
MKKLGASIFLGIVSIAAAYGLETIFEENQPGYLYSLGGHGYVFNAETAGMPGVHSALAITHTPEYAMSMKIIRKVFRGITYSIMIADPEACKNILSVNGSYCVFKYTRMMGARTGLILGKEKATFDNYFMFSPPVTRDTNAFQIYNQGKCVTVDRHGVLDLAECIEAPTQTREKQLFRWVNKDWYDKGMSAKQSHKFTGIKN